mmetsp:Transcript_2706/g.4094  ORF Transcript_2706/g.4094 Transcript_2706/m.4094 type:complete len:126 (+) Transcript_2706:226-603(+)
MNCNDTLTQAVKRKHISSIIFCSRQQQFLSEIHESKDVQGSMECLPERNLLGRSPPTGAAQIRAKVGQKKTAGSKRKNASLADSGAAKKSKAVATSEMNDHIERVLTVELPQSDSIRVYDSCQEL